MKISGKNSKPIKPLKVQSEKQVVQSCKAWLKRNGWITKTIYTGGIPTYTGASVPNPAKGIPDSINFHVKDSLCVWIEYKSSIGKVSVEQEWWHTHLNNCGHIVLVVNSLDSLKIQILEKLK